MASSLTVSLSHTCTSSTPHRVQFFVPNFFSIKTSRFYNTNSTIQLIPRSLHIQSLTSSHNSLRTSRIAPISAAMATGSVKEVLPPPLGSTSDPPPVFDGTTRLYISYSCPYAQRAWIARNCKGLQDKIKLVPIDLQNKPAWYKENVYPPGKVPSLEHNNEVKGESLDLIKYIDSNFDGTPLFPDDPARKELAEELFTYTDTFNKALASLFKGEADEAGAVLDFIETSLSKFDDGPFFLGNLSLVDIAYAPFVERFQPTLLEIREYDITAGRPNLAAWIEAINKIEAYNQTRSDPKEHVEKYKRRFLAQP